MSSLVSFASDKLTTDPVLTHTISLGFSLLIYWAVNSDFLVLFADQRLQYDAKLMWFGVTVVLALQGIIMTIAKYGHTCYKRRAAHKSLDTEAAYTPLTAGQEAPSPRAESIMTAAKNIADRLADPVVRARVIDVRRRELEQLRSTLPGQQESHSDYLASAKKVADNEAAFAQLLAIDEAAQGATQDAAEAAQHPVPLNLSPELQELYNNCRNCRAAIEHGATTQREIRAWIQFRQAHPEAGCFMVTIDGSDDN